MSTVTLLIPVHDPSQEYESLILNALRSVAEQTRQPDEVLVVANHKIGYWGKIDDVYVGSRKYKLRCPRGQR